MVSAKAPSMTITIVLPEDAADDKEIRQAQVRHGGDILRGHLQVVTSSDFEFDITVQFQGVIKTWLSGGYDTNANSHTWTKELQFLKQAQVIRANRSLRCSQQEGYKCQLPFDFTIPSELIAAHSDVHPDFLKLCPSTNANLAGGKSLPGSFYSQPSIKYSINIAHIHAEIILPPTHLRYESREVFIMPYSYATPPIEVGHFPNEYTCHNTKVLKQHAFSRALGRLTLSAIEPVPINLLTTAPRASTLASIKLRFSTPDSTKSSARTGRRNWICSVKSCLRIRTFYATRKMEYVPTLANTKTNAFLGMNERKTKWETREFGGIAWLKERSILGINHRDDGNPEQQEEELEEVWMAMLEVPVNVSKELLPTFLNLLSARQYALVLQVHIKQVWHAPLEVVVPLQLIYCPALDLPPRFEEFDDGFVCDGRSDWEFLCSEAEDPLLPPYYGGGS